MEMGFMALMCKEYFCVNASNLHVGGGVQVAVSFLEELARMSVNEAVVSVLVSSEIEQNLSDQAKLGLAHQGLKVIDVFGLDLFNFRARSAMSSCKTVFTVFGPIYRYRPTFKTIVGFAQPWIIYPDNECYAMLPLMQRLKTRLKYWVQGLFFKRADVLVVELEHVKKGLIRTLGIPAERIYVVHNCISSIYLDESMWQAVYVPKNEGFLRLGFLGRNYIHKNTAIFPAIAAALEHQHGLKARFYVTFTEQEWAACPPDFHAVCINVGPLSVAQCPRFYQALDAVVFPSLLEGFSATPLEAMAMEKPLFASDRPFNRDVCQGHAHYFDPLSPASAAQAIARFFLSGGPNLVALQAAREHAINFSSPKQRAEQYLALLIAGGKSPILD